MFQETEEGSVVQMIVRHLDEYKKCAMCELCKNYVLNNNFF